MITRRMRMKFREDAFINSLVQEHAVQMVLNFKETKCSN